MGLMTFDEIKAEVKANLGNRDDFDSRLLAIVNRVQIRAVREHDFSELRQLTTTGATIAHTKLYDIKDDITLAASYEDIRNLYTLSLISGTNSRRLKPLPAQLLDTGAPYPESGTEAKSNWYSVWGDKLQFHRIPDDIYVLHTRWSAWPSTRTGAETSDLRNKDDVLIAFATAYCFDSLGAAAKEQATHWWLIGRDLLDRAKLDDQKKPYMEIKPEFEYRSGLGQYWADPFVKSVPQ